MLSAASLVEGSAAGALRGAAEAGASPGRVNVSAEITTLVLRDGCRAKANGFVSALRYSQASLYEVTRSQRDGPRASGPL